MAYTQNHGFILLWHVPPIEVFKYPHRNGEYFPSANIFYVQALYKYKNMCTGILCVSMLLECNISECLHLYEKFKVHIRRLNNWFKLGNPRQ